MVRHLGIIMFLLAAWAMPSAALAHPMLDRAVAAYEEADFEAALRTFDTAERNADLSVEELLQLFELRALVHHALGDQVAMERDLRRLVAVRGSYELSRLAPPSVRLTFEEIRAEDGGASSVELRIEETRIEGHPWMVARLIRAPEGLVDHTTLQCNVDNSARTVSRTSKGESVSVKLPATGAHNGCAATARTRQGGVLFSAHVEGAHALMAAGKGTRFSMPKYTSRDGEPKAKKKKWPWIVAASAVVVAGGITAGVLLSRRSSDSSGAQAGGVTVEW